MSHTQNHVTAVSGVRDTADEVSLIHIRVRRLTITFDPNIWVHRLLSLLFRKATTARED